MPAIPIETLDDPRVQMYRSLKAQNISRQGPWFIAEGVRVVERLLDSNYETESVLLTERRAEEWLPKIREGIPVYVVPQSEADRLVGFNFHVGVVACGRRRRSPALEAVLPQDRRRQTVVVCPNCDNPENLGAIVRMCLGFGVDLLLLGPHCSDAFSRRVIRVSMGAIFRQPVIETRNLERDLVRLREEWGFEFAATLLDPSAVPLDPSTPRADRFGLLFGNEAFGLDDRWIELCDRRLTIPMGPEADSLNVAVATGIFLHHFQRQTVPAPLPEVTP
jgi:tRNA G18 (ribose-2'-O)-methylase SpoU